MNLRHREVPLWLLAAATLACYLVFPFWFPLAGRFNQAPVADIRTFAPSLTAGLVYAAVLCLLYALYLAAWRGLVSWRWLPAVRSPWPILLAAAVFALPLLFAFPINANDIYRYFIRGRITAVHRQSPYLLAPADLPDEPYLPLAGEWAGETSPYGPVWEGVAAAVAALNPDNLWLAVLSFKLLGLLLHLAAAGLVWLCLAGAEPAERAGRTLLWACNPALLLTFVMDAHNDVLMIVWLLLGYWLVLRGRLTLGLVVMVLAPLTKPIGLLPLPFLAMAAWQAAPGWPARLRLVLASGVASLVLAWLAFLPFGSPLVLAGRLWREAAGGASFSLPTLLILLARQVGVDLTIESVANVATVLFGLIALWLLWLVWRGRSPLRGAAAIFAAYVLQALNFRIWYAVWPFPWLLLADERQGNANITLPFGLTAALYFLLTSQLSVILYGHVRVYLLGRDQTLAHLIGVPFTFLLPLLLARWLRPFSSRPTSAPGAGGDNPR